MYGSKGSGQCKKRKEVYSRTALSYIAATGEIGLLSTQDWIDAN